MSSEEISLLISMRSLMNNLFYLILGLAIGCTLAFYIKTFPNNFQLYQLSSIPSSHSPISPSPSPFQQPSLPPLQPPPPPPARNGLNEYLKLPSTLMHDMTDEELLWRASMEPRVPEFPYQRKPKVAFLFLIQFRLPMAPLWEQFFKGYEDLYSIYVHTNPLYNGSFPVNSVFYRRRIPSKEVHWGWFDMVEAERRLLANALLDLSNQRFVLLSESCIPLFNFQTVYSYLINSTKSFVEVYDKIGHDGRGRYNIRMMPHIKLEQWRKGSQWFEMDRALAVEVISDQKYYALFRKYCTHDCYGDEHYIPTFVNIKFSRRNSNRSVKWVDWSRVGAHPKQYRRTDVTIRLLNRLRNGTNCRYNGKYTTVCYLFARKFLPDTLGRLLRWAPTLMGFNH